MDTRFPDKGLKKTTDAAGRAKTDVPRPKVSKPPMKTEASSDYHSSTPAKTTKPAQHMKTEKNARFATPVQTEKSKNPSMAAKTAQTTKTPITKAEKADKTVNGPVANSKSTSKSKGTKIQKADTLTDSMPSTRETYLNSTKGTTKAEKTAKASAAANSKSTGKTGGLSTQKPSTTIKSNLSTATTYLNSTEADSRSTGGKSTVPVSSEAVFTYGKALKAKTSVLTTDYGYTGQCISQGYGLGANQGNSIKPEKSAREVKRDRLIKVLRYFAYT
ncbi:hypothetical protein LTR84_013187 [Exophiala bonariae]|uniref:Uncharacterized protein n=1 Tax=Exophiala bonariae TaxID=1690606 RepID=A0AAV9NFA3_9EURO|nr:hypothetical protein LTR84_013187 [Exophiala bonariae]